MEILPLHTRWDLLESCVDLLNSVWNRSPEARTHSLRKCSENFPISLVMIRQGPLLTEVPAKVLGHTRLTFIPGKSASCWVESVVVDKSLRGRGYGRILMAATENYAKGRGFCELFLSTHDAQDFYKAVGYDFCPPVVTMGSASSLLQSTQAVGLLQKMASANSNLATGNQLLSPKGNFTKIRDTKQNFDSDEQKSVNISSRQDFPGLPPPPPPPPPLPKTSFSNGRPVIEHHPAITVYYMSKII